MALLSLVSKDAKRGPRCGSGPKCPLEGLLGGPFPPTAALPSCPTPHFLQCSGGLARGRRRTGVEGEGPLSGTWGLTHIWAFEM